MLITGNWKMFKGPAEAKEFARALREADLPENVDVAVCPAFVSLADVVQALAGTEIGVFAQNCGWADEGALTGEVSPPMLKEIGVYGTLVGHSERRQLFGETDATVSRRVHHCLASGMHVIACVGETEEERDAGATHQVLRHQVAALEADENLVIAYEPVWAIGTGKTATPQMAQEAHETIKELIEVPMLYGGSVKPENAAELMSQPAIDGALVGGASLELDAFVAICQAASTS
jgi:triosephosphate isomerase